jgi:proteasome accessory factor C
MPERATAAERLHRLLYALPAAAREGGVPVDALAQRFGIDAAEVLRDLEEATAASYHRPAGSADPFSILIEAGQAGAVVEVQTTGEFERPVRLTPKESLTLVLGLRAMAADVEQEQRDGVLELAKRMERELGSSLVHAERERSHGSKVQPAEDAHDGALDPDAVLAAAAERRCCCAIRYIKPGGAPEDRTIEPWRLVSSAGRSYVLARDVAADDLRLFRTDRVLAAETVEGESFEVPEDFDVSEHLKDGRAFFAREVETVTVRYAEPAARWVAESLGTPRGEDGSVTFEHAVADRTWLVRRVLSYGGAAVVVAPEEIRREVAVRAERVAGRLAEE